VDVRRSHGTPDPEVSRVADSQYEFQRWREVSGILRCDQRRSEENRVICGQETRYDVSLGRFGGVPTHQAVVPRQTAVLRGPGHILDGQTVTRP